jgi:hypothetical protein
MTKTRKFNFQLLQKYEEALRTIASQSDAAVSESYAGAWARLVATHALKAWEGK